MKVVRFASLMSELIGLAGSSRSSGNASRRASGASQRELERYASLSAARTEMGGQSTTRSQPFTRSLLRVAVFIHDSSTHDMIAASPARAPPRSHFVYRARNLG